MAFAGTLVAIAFALPADAANPEDVIATYADIAQAGYEDSAAEAHRLLNAVERLIAEPSAATLAAARDAWVRSRVPYMQTEVFRFGNPVVDAWEGKVNAWPLDEGLIDYVSGTNANVNVIANRTFELNGRTVEAELITWELLEETLHEAAGIETNVATGYHAVEFLLWGQDLNGTGPGSGNRPASDFDLSQCSGGNCDRRIAYLRAATTLLIRDLEWMAAAWGSEGEARAALYAQGPVGGLRAILAGLGNLASDELAGARMEVGLALNDPEEEHDCFSDNTHESHYWNAAGLRNVYFGEYTSTDGELVAGPSIADLITTSSPELASRLEAGLDLALQRVDAIRARVNEGKAYDQMLAEGDDDGRQLIGATIVALLEFSEELLAAGTALGLGNLEWNEAG